MRMPWKPDPLHRRRAHVAMAAAALLAGCALPSTAAGADDGDQAPYPAPVETIPSGSGAAWLADVLERRDFDALTEPIRGPFIIRFAPDSGSDLIPGGELSERFDRVFRPLSTSPVAFATPPAPLAPVTETLRGAIDPVDAIDAVVFAHGWGADGRGEARIVLARRPDGEVYPAAMEYAAAGFDAPPSAVDALRTVTLTLSTKRGLVLSADIPASWHSETRGSSPSILSQPTWNYPDDGPYYPPGATKIEFYGRDRDRPGTIDEWIGAMREPGGTEPPTWTTEPVTLASGEPATLAHIAYPSAEYTELYIPTDRGMAMGVCFHHQPPCEAILRSVRIVARP